MLAAGCCRAIYRQAFDAITHRGHFVAINALVGALEGDDRVTVFRPGHCSVTRLERRGAGLRVAEYGSEAATRVL